MKALSATPLLPLHDLEAGAAFLRDCFGFEVLERAERRIGCQLGPVTLQLISAAPEADLSDPARELVIFIRVDDVDAFHEGHRTALEGLEEGKFRAPFDQPYGLREMHVIHGPFLFVLGHAIEGATP